MKVQRGGGGDGKGHKGIQYLRKFYNSLKSSLCPKNLMFFTFYRMLLHFHGLGDVTQHLAISSFSSMTNLPVLFINRLDLLVKGAKGLTTCFLH